MVRDLVDTPLEGVIEQLVAPAATELHVEHIDPLPREKRGHVDAVGDVADRIFLGWDLRPDVALHLGGNVAVDAADAVMEA